MKLFNFLKKKPQEKKQENPYAFKEENVKGSGFVIGELGNDKKNKNDDENDILSHYIKRIKDDERIKELFPEIIQKLEEDLSREEKRKLIKPIEMYEVMEDRKRSLFSSLADEYNNIVKRLVEENYELEK